MEEPSNRGRDKISAMDSVVIHFDGFKNLLDVSVELFSYKNLKSLIKIINLME